MNKSEVVEMMVARLATVREALKAKPVSSIESYNYIVVYGKYDPMPQKLTVSNGIATMAPSKFEEATRFTAERASDFIRLVGGDRHIMLERDYLEKIATELEELIEELTA